MTPVYTFSATNLNVVLEQGIVCDNCNKYFGVKLENHFCENHPGAHFKSLLVKETKKGRPPKSKLTHGVITREDSKEESHHKFPIKRVESETLPNGNIQMNGIFETPPFKSKIISRTLGKIALECMAGADISELNPYDKKWDSLKQYIRNGTQNEYYWFAYKIEDTPSTEVAYQQIQAEDNNLTILFVEIPFPRIKYFFPMENTLKPENVNFSDKEWRIIPEDMEVAEREEKLIINFNKQKLTAPKSQQ